MPTHAEKRHLTHSPKQMFDLVSNVADYPEFLPWCVGTRIKSQDDQQIVADMVIGYKMFRETFSSRVICQKPDRIDVTYFDGPFKYLNNHWIFEAQDNGECLIDFYVDFEFKSRFFQATIGAVFNEAVKMMISAFEKRADALYGNGK